MVAFALLVVFGLFELVLCYLVGRVAFNEGRKSKWEEMCRDYICLHKSVLIMRYETGGNKKTLDKRGKKSYNNLPAKRNRNR